MLDADFVEQINKRATEETYIVSIVPFPYFDDVDVKNVHAVLKGSICEVETGPKSTPMS